MNLSLKSTSPSKTRQGSPSPSKKKDKQKGFPTTPRSAEKTKNTMVGKLKRLMEANMRLTASNAQLKTSNKQLLDSAVVSPLLLTLYRQQKCVTISKRSCFPKPATK